ncbi:MAG: metalloregulator ArsR/SmtB family transcription factor [Spirochaetaceae bacterium]|nr:MAG: metalloregulator ArsR/SmtB family transcription factor [Spirochaetaceae bacterium]
MVVFAANKALRYFKALSDETRLRLLNILCFQEFNVQELMGILDMGQSRISRHLKLLLEGGLIESRRDGLWAFYRAVDQDPGRRFSDSIRYLFDEEPIYREDLTKASAVLKTDKLQSRRFFDTVASNWEIMKRSIIGELDLVGEIRKRIPPAETATDLGCGSGALLEQIAETVNTVIGVDSSRKMLAEAAKRLDHSGREIDLRIGELEHLPLRDEETEIAIINLVLHHLRNPREGLLEARRILSHGGTLIIADLCKHEQEVMRSRFGDHWLGFSREEIESWLEEAGFDIQERKQYPVRRGLEVFLYRGSKREQT